MRPTLRQTARRFGGRGAARARRPWHRLLSGLLLPTVAVAASCGQPTHSASSSTTTSSAVVSTTGPGGTTTTTGGPAACGLAPGSGWELVTGTPEPCTVRTAVGATIGLSLDAGFRWGDPTSDSAAVTVRGVARPAGGAGLRATVVARAPGTATLVATGGVACPPGTPCPALARLWSLRILVAAHPGGAVPVAVADTDGGRRYALHTGDRLELRLQGADGYSWSAPASSDVAVTRALAAGGGATATATFLAVGPGTAHITATDSPDCYPQCLPPSRQFGIDVVVSG